MTKARSKALSTDAPHAVYYALASNIAVAISKYLAAFFTHSGSTLAEAVHSSADCLNQLVLLFGDRAARARPDEEHPLGFGRENYVYGMLVAMQLFVIGGLVSVAVGIVRIIHVTPIEHPGLAIAVLCTAGVIEGLALRASIRTIKPSHRARGLLAWFRESGKPAVMLAVGEDIASVTGVLLSLLAIVTSLLTGNPIFDALGSISVGLVLMATALFSMREIKSLLVGESARPQTRQAMNAWLEARREIQQIVSLVVLKWADDLVVAIQAELVAHDNAIELVRAIDRIENEFKDAFPAARWIFFEPELREHGHNPV